MVLDYKTKNNKLHCELLAVPAVQMMLFRMAICAGTDTGTGTNVYDYMRACALHLAFKYICIVNIYLKINASHK